MSKHTLPLIKAEDPEGYKKEAAKGIMVGYPVKIAGQHARPDNGIHYHSTVKFFDPSKDHVHAVHQIAQHLPLNPPDARNTQIKPDQFKDRSGSDVFVLTLHGNSADKIKEHNGKFAGMGYPANYEFKPHISLDKATWDKIKASGAKTAHEAGIEFGNAELKHGPKTIRTYDHPADTTDPKVPDESDMTAKVPAVPQFTKSENENKGLRSYGEYRSALKHADSIHKHKINKAQGDAPKSSAKVRGVADSYAESKGLKLNHDIAPHNVNTEHAGKIANAYDQMKHDPSHPDVKRAYGALSSETLNQFKHLKNNGLKISRIQPGQENPYKGGSKDLTNDISSNNHMWYYPTESGFGSSDAEHKDHPLLAPSGETHEGKPLLHNDLFRIVHDYFGHAKEGHSFGPKGEDNAWKHHMQMYSPEAQKALTSETRGQNSWVNYGPHGEANRKNPANTIYAPQKAGILPSWTSEIKEAAPANKVVTEAHMPKLAASEKNNISSLEKGALKNAGIALGMAGALAGSSQGASTHANRSPASIQQPKVQTPSYDHKKMLNAIMQVESSGGKNLNHKPTANGDVAFGKYALMPGTIKDTIKSHKDLKAKYGKALSLSGPNLHRFMQDNKGLEDILADRHLSHVEKHFKTPEETGFAWNQGIVGTNRAKQEGKKISEHPYVQKIKGAYENSR